MKRKHHGLLSVALMLLAMGAAGAYAVDRIWRTQKAVVIPAVGVPLSEIFVPGPEQMKTTKQLSLRMADLQFPHKTDQTPVRLTLFGHYPAVAPDQSRRSLATTGLDAVPLTLTFAFTSGKRQFCIIDGAFYQVGSTLPDNSRIARIESRRVLIERGGEKRWIQLKANNLSNARSMQDTGRMGKRQEVR